MEEAHQGETEPQPVDQWTVMFDLGYGLKEVHLWKLSSGFQRIQKNLNLITFTKFK